MADFNSEMKALKDQVQRDAWADLRATTEAHNAKAQKKADAANAAAARIAAKYGQRLSRTFRLGNGPDSVAMRPRMPEFL
jgi:hypothetical protein